MADGGGHTADLAVFSFGQFQTDPARRHGFAEANRRDACRGLRLRIEQPCAARQGLATLKVYALAQLRQSLGTGDSFDLRPILPFVAMARMEHFLVKINFVAQQKQAFRISVEPANRIDGLWETELGQRTIFGAVRRELRKDAVGFVECEEQKKVSELMS